MKSFLYLLGFVLLFYSCSSTSGNENTSSETANNSTESTEPMDPSPVSEKTGMQPEPITLGEFNAVIVGSGVRSRDLPGTDGNVIRAFKFGELVKVIESTDERVALTSGTSCDEYGYYWHLVMDTDYKESWVFGKFVYYYGLPDNLDCESAYFDINRNGEAPKFSSEWNLNGTDYSFLSAMSLSYGPSDEDGLTGCDIIYLPFLHEAGNTSVKPFYFVDDIGEKSDLSWKNDEFDVNALMLIAGSEGGSDEINTLNSVTWEGKDGLEIEVEFFYQDGSSEGKLIIIEEDDRFIVVSYENTGVTY